MNQIIKLSLIEKIASKRFEMDAVAAMGYHAAKLVTLRRLDLELADLVKQLRNF